MPFIFILIAIMLIFMGYRGTQKDFFALLKGDFTGQNNFIYWIISLFVVGAIGYIPKLKNFSDSFMVLILLILIISNNGFFNKFTSQIKEISNG